MNTMIRQYGLKLNLNIRQFADIVRNGQVARTMELQESTKGKGFAAFNPNAFATVQLTPYFPTKAELLEHVESQAKEGNL